MASAQNTPIDRNHLTEMTGGDVEFEAELMQEFLSSVPGLIASVEAAIAAHNMKDLEMAAHTLKGSCRSLGAMILSNPCEKLETIARQGSGEDSMPSVEEIHKLYQETHEYIMQEWNVKAA